MRGTYSFAIKRCLKKKVHYAFSSQKSLLNIDMNEKDAVCAKGRFAQIISLLVWHRHLIPFSINIAM